MAKYFKKTMICIVLAEVIGSSTFASTLQGLQLPSTVSQWTDRIHFSGAINAAGFASNRTPNTAGTIPSNIGSSPPASDINITFANLTADAKLTNWFQTLLAASYQQTSPSFIRNAAGGGDTFFIDQAYITIANAKCTPFYSKIGRRFVNFGGLDNSTYLESTTQLLSLARQTTLELGFEQWNHFNGSIYLFRGFNRVNQGNTNRANVFGTAIGYGQNNNSISYYLGAGYLSNIVSALYSSSTVANGSPLVNSLYTTAVNGLDLHGNIVLNQFDVSAKYITALNPYSAIDLPYTTNGGATFKGAKPSAWGLNGGYSFDIRQYETRLGVGYQGSSQAVSIGRAYASTTNTVAGVYGTSFAIGMPKKRYYANYTVTVNKWAKIGAEFAHDSFYGAKNGGVDRNANIGLVTILTKFA